jgi:enterochelin esterase-like enzyme
MEPIVMKKIPNGEAKIQHLYYESPGTDHEWQTWRRDLKEFAPRLFQ